MYLSFAIKCYSTSLSPKQVTEDGLKIAWSQGLTVNTTARRAHRSPSVKFSNSLKRVQSTANHNVCVDLITQCVTDNSQTTASRIQLLSQ